MLLSRRACLAPLALGWLSLSACGYVPLYRGGEHAQLRGNVRLKAQKRGELTFELHRMASRVFRERADAPLTLALSPRISTRDIIIEEDDAITRINYVLELGYALSAVEGEVLAEGSVRSISGYNATASQYATLVAKREARSRALQDAIDKVQRRLAARFDPGWLK